MNKSLRLVSTLLLLALGEGLLRQELQVFVQVTFSRHCRALCKQFRQPSTQV